MKEKIDLDYDFSHKLDRPGQQETFDKILDCEAEVIVVEGQTGTGKTALIAELSKYYRVMALTFTKSLQTQYAKGYGFLPLYGLGNYRCNKFSGSNIFVSASTCSDLSENYRPCVERGPGGIIEEKHDCPYPICRAAAVDSNRLSMNVAKFVTDRSIVDDHQPEVLVVDEAHLLDDYLIDFGGYKMNWTTEYYKVDPVEFRGIGQDAHNAAQDILLEMFNQVSFSRPLPPQGPEDIKGLAANRKWNNIYKKIESLVKDRSRLDFYYEGSKDEFLVKPLTSKHIFRRLFMATGRKVILMTATPGAKGNLAALLGLDNNEWDHISGIERFKPEDRPIKVLRSPAMTGLYVSRYDKNRDQKLAKIESKKQKHANVIAKEILSYPAHWQGLITVTSYAMAEDLSERLSKHKINTFVPKRGAGTDNQLKDMFRKFDLRIGDEPRYRAVISCTHNEGVDLGRLQFVILGKIPFPFIGDNYTKSRKNHQPKWYMSATANTASQILGRIRRGLEEHYGPDAEKSVVIADGSYKSVIPYWSESIVASLIKIRVTNVLRPKKGRKLVAR